MGRIVITLAYDTHQNNTVVSLRFEKDYSLISKVKSIKSAVWSQSRGFWYIPSEVFNLSEVFDILSPVAYLDYSALSPGKPKTEQKTTNLNNPIHKLAALHQNEGHQIRDRES